MANLLETQQNKTSQQSNVPLTTEQDFKNKQQAYANQPASRLENTDLAKATTAYTGRPLGEAGKSMLANFMRSASSSLFSVPVPSIMNEQQQAEKFKQSTPQYKENMIASLDAKIADLVGKNAPLEEIKELQEKKTILRDDQGQKEKEDQSERRAKGQAPEMAKSDGLLGHFKPLGEAVEQVAEGKVNPIAGSIGLAGKTASGILATAIDWGIKGAQVDDAAKFLYEKSGATEYWENLPDKVKEGIVENTVIPMQKLMGEYEEWKKENPNIAMTLEGTVGIGDAVLTVMTGKPTFKTLTSGLDDLARNAAKPIATGLDKAKALGTQLKKEGTDLVESTVTKAKDVKKIVGDKLDARSEQKIKDTVGRIAQAEKKDIPQVRKALSNLDTKDVKTFTELKEKGTERIGQLSKELDKILDTDKTPTKIKDLVKTTVVGNRKVKQNFVAAALNDLEELYTKTGAGEDLARIKNLRDKGKSIGLTNKEINNIAKEYNSDFGGKAFSKRTGDPLTSVNAQRFENTRKGVKDTFRSRITGDVPKALDKEMSSIYKMNNVVSDMEKKVNALFQKVKKRGIMEKFSRELADAFDMATFGTVRGFLNRLLPSNVGLKTMNALDIEAELMKNLKKIKKLESKLDPKIGSKEILPTKTKLESISQPKPSTNLPESKISEKDLDSIFGKRKNIKSKKIDVDPEDIRSVTELNIAIKDNLITKKEMQRLLTEKKAGLAAQFDTEKKLGQTFKDRSLNTEKAIKRDKGMIKILEKKLDFKQGAIPTTTAKETQLVRKVYRGTTNAARDERTIEGVLSTSENKDVAKIFAGKNGKVQEFTIDPKAKIIKVENITNELKKTKNISEITPKDWVNYAKENKYDAIDMKSLKMNIQSRNNPNLKGFEDEIKIINPKILKESKTLSSSPLIQEAKKYKSADEFVKAQKVESFLDKNFTKSSKNKHEYFIPTENGKVAIIATTGKEGQIMLHNIRSISKGKGAGNKALKVLTDFADKNNKRIKGFIAKTEPGGLSKDQLSKWYQKNGFEISTSPSATWITREPKDGFKTTQQLTEIWKKANK